MTTSQEHVALQIQHVPSVYHLLEQKYENFNEKQTKF